MKSQIYKIGVEIEGEFTADLHSQLQELGGQMKYDGSVHNCRPTVKFHRDHPHRLGTGEYVTQPIALADKKHFKKVFDLLEAAKKDGRFHWNKSAGFHIHVSFKPKVPPEIRSTQFTKFALEKLQQEFPLEYRIRTATNWCRVTGLDKDENLIQNVANRDRYKAINYASFTKHGTLEFRIFPAKHPYKMYEYFRFTIKMLNEYLAQEHTMKFETEIEETEEKGVEHTTVATPRNQILETNV